MTLKVISCLIMMTCSNTEDKLTCFDKQVNTIIQMNNKVNLKGFTNEQIKACIRN